MHGTIKATSTRQLFARSRKQRFADLVSRYCADCGGEDQISETVRSYIRRISFIECTLEDLEQDYVRLGSISPKDRTEYQKLTTTQSKLMRAIGLINSSPRSDDEDDDDMGFDIAHHATSRPLRLRPIVRERLEPKHGATE